MRTKGRRLMRRLAVALTGVVTLGMLHATNMAGSTDCLEKLNVGAAAVLEGDLVAKANVESVSPVKGSHTEDKQKNEEMEKGSPDDDDPEKSNLVMANVQNAVNVREKADEESDKVGLLYSDCGGEILERRNGWTKLKSGNVVGWTKDEYLLFGKEAEEMAEDVGNLIVTIRADALRVRKGPGEDEGVFGMIAKDEEIDAIEVVNKKWVSVEYGGEVGYVAADYVNVDFHIDTGETIQEIKAREQKEAEEKAKAAAEKAKVTQNRGAVPVSASDDILLAALIQCEAGGQPYEGQLAVGAVVMNRVRSGGYPNTIQGVIYASGQFPPALSGAVARKIEKGISPSCLQAAQEAIAGASNVGGSTHFRRAGNREGIVIGNHVFW